MAGGIELVTGKEVAVGLFSIKENETSWGFT
jgi:hypothetical protein